jgi:catechol 2,3-dioxygenase-like lactoylglutathione lyase family enzyme
MKQQVLSHVIVGTNDAARAMKFYDEVLGILGHERRWQGDGGAGYGKGDERGVDTFWITKPLDGEPATVGNGSNVCFVASTRDAVDAFHKAAIKMGGADEGAPGIRAEVHDNFYACYVRDPDGNKIVAACHDPLG